MRCDDEQVQYNGRALRARPSALAGSKQLVSCNPDLQEASRVQVVSNEVDDLRARVEHVPHGAWDNVITSQVAHAQVKTQEARSTRPYNAEAQTRAA